MNFCTQHPRQYFDNSFDAIVVFQLDSAFIGQSVRKHFDVLKPEDKDDGHVGFVVLQVHKESSVQKIIYIQLDEPKQTKPIDYADVFAKLSLILTRERIHSVAVDLSSIKKEAEASKIIDGAVTGLSLAMYNFSVHKTKHTEGKEIRSVTFFSDKHDGLSKQLQTSILVVDAVIAARNLVNEPASITTPNHLSLFATDIAKKSKNISCTIFDRKKMEMLGMGALLSIAKGGNEEPSFIELRYKGKSDKTIVLIGKGITFDSGGLSLKPSSSMETMKCDMAGAATILGLFSILDRLLPDVSVVGLIAATENMPSATSIKPGDVVKAMDGQTIEILNTDAEGRVILADAFNYWKSLGQKAHAIIDLATLTGACVVSLGEDVAGMFSNSDSLAEKLFEHSKQTGEKIWRLPIVQEYDSQLDSDVADIRNVSPSKYAGAITGALFIQRFVPPPDVSPWAHLDIAGPAFAEKATPLVPRGGTGFGVRLLLSYLQAV